ncbi:MAG: rhodanese-like domain-containing protein [Deinococcales bacterium]
MESITPEAFKELLSNTQTLWILDTRSATEISQFPLGFKVQRLSLAEVQAGKLPHITKDVKLYLLCERGQISELVGLYLELAGFTEIYNLAGGLRALRQLES